MAADPGKEEMAQRRSDCLQMVAHDLGNPLTAIRVIAEIIKEDAVEDDARRDARDLLEAADLAGALVESMGAMLSLEGEPEDLTWFPIDLVQVLRKVVDRPYLRRRITLDLPQEIQLAGDRRALGRAFTDVLVNALRIAPPLGQVSVHVRTPEGGVEVRVDHGATNLAPALWPLLLAPYGAVVLRRKKIPTLATGLVYAQHIFSRHGGGLRLAQGPNGGMDVVCTLAR